jgi:hypothetical protein
MPEKLSEIFDRDEKTMWIDMSVLFQNQVDQLASTLKSQLERKPFSKKKEFITLFLSLVFRCWSR